MRQLYKIVFRSKRGPLTEIGTLLVCADDASCAEATVAAHLDIPFMSIEFTTTRVKPSIYELHRKEYVDTEAVAAAKENKAPPPPPPVRPIPSSPPLVHDITVSANVVAYSESVALRRLAEALIESASARRSALPQHVSDFEVHVGIRPCQPKRSRLSEQGQYKESRIFQGGAARPR